MKVNDLNIYPLAPVPVTPPRGQVFMDPTFQTPILRVTDATDGSGFANAYSAIYDATNMDSSRIAYVNTMDGSTWVVGLDVVAHATAGIKKQVLTTGGLIWSRTNANVFYTFQGMILKAFSFTSGVWTTIRDFTADCPGQTTINNRGMSWDDRYFHVSFTDGSNVAIYDRVADKLIGPVSLATAQKTYPALTAFDWGKTTMDVSGTFVITATGPQLVYNIRTGVGLLTAFGTPTNQYGDVHPDLGPSGMIASAGGMPGHSELGLVPMMIGPVDPNNLGSYLTARRQIGPHCVWGIDTHSSFRDGKWNTLTYDAGQPTGADAGKTPIFDSEIFQLSPQSPADGSLNRRIVRHYSDPSTVDASQSYWAAPKGTIAQDGRVLVYNSTYGNKRIDVYVAFLDDPKPVQPLPPITDMLAGVEFSHDEAMALKAQAQWMLSQKHG